MARGSPKATRSAGPTRSAAPSARAGARPRPRRSTTTPTEGSAHRLGAEPPPLGRVWRPSHRRSGERPWLVPAIWKASAFADRRPREDRAPRPPPAGPEMAVADSRRARDQRRRHRRRCDSRRCRVAPSPARQTRPRGQRGGRPRWASPPRSAPSSRSRSCSRNSALISCGPGTEGTCPSKAARGCAASSADARGVEEAAATASTPLVPQRHRQRRRLGVREGHRRPGRQQGPAPSPRTGGSGRGSRARPGRDVEPGSSSGSSTRCSGASRKNAASSTRRSRACRPSTMALVTGCVRPVREIEHHIEAERLEAGEDAAGQASSVVRTFREARGAGAGLDGGGMEVEHCRRTSRCRRGRSRGGDCFRFRPPADRVEDVARRHLERRDRPDCLPPWSWTMDARARLFLARLVELERGSRAPEDQTL